VPPIPPILVVATVRVKNIGRTGLVQRLVIERRGSVHALVTVPFVFACAVKLGEA
jgi:hypothetical protein